MNTALCAAELAQKKKEAHQDEMENGDETRPILPEVNKSLVKQWGISYGYTLHPHAGIHVAAAEWHVPCPQR